MKDYATLRIGIKHTIDDDAVVVEMGVEQRAEAVDEDHGAEAGRGKRVARTNQAFRKTVVCPFAVTAINLAG